MIELASIQGMISEISVLLATGKPADKRKAVAMMERVVNLSSTALAAMKAQRK